MKQWAMGLKPAVRNCKKDNKITEEEMDCIWAVSNRSLHHGPDHVGDGQMDVCILT